MDIYNYQIAATVLGLAGGIVLYQASKRAITASKWIKVTPGCRVYRLSRDTYGYNYVWTVKTADYTKGYMTFFEKDGEYTMDREWLLLPHSSYFSCPYAAGDVVKLVLAENCDVRTKSGRQAGKKTFIIAQVLTDAKGTQFRLKFDVELVQDKDNKEHEVLASPEIVDLVSTGGIGSDIYSVLPANITSTLTQRQLMGDNNA